MPALSTLVGTTIFPVVNINTNYQVSAAQIQTFCNNTANNITTQANLVANNAIITTSVTSNSITATTLTSTNFNTTYIGAGNAIVTGNIRGGNISTTGNLSAGNISVTNSVYFSDGSSQSTAYPNKTKAAFVNPGVPVQVGNLQVQLAPSGNTSLQLKWLGTGNLTLAGSGSFTLYNDGYPGAETLPQNITTLVINNSGFTYISAGDDFNIGADQSYWVLVDLTSTYAWRITAVMGNQYATPAYANTMIFVEQLVP